MWWLIPVGIGVVGLGLELLSQSVSEDERRARRNWERKRVQVERSLEEHQRHVETHLYQAQNSYDFRFLTDLHYSSVKVADVAYQSFNDARLSLTGINKMLGSAKQQRTQLQQTLELAKANKDKVLIHDTIEQLKIINELRKSLFDDREKVQQQLNDLLAKVKQLNNRTKELKDLINNRCGIKGREWYNRIEARKQQKRLGQLA